VNWFPMPFRTPIGVDVGRKQVKAAQLRRLGRGWRIEAICAFPRANVGSDIDSEDARHLRGVLRRQGFSGRDIVLAVPPEMLKTGILELPSRVAGAPMSQIARMELARMSGVQPDSFEMSYWRLPPSEKDKGSAQVMAVGCAHEQANTLLDAFEDQGLNVRALDVRACASARACRAMLAPPPGSTAILDVGWGACCLSIVCGGVVTYERLLGGAGMGSLTKAIAQKFRLEDQLADRLIAEVGLDADGGDGGREGRAFEDVRLVLARHFDSVIDELRAPFLYVSQQYPGAAVKRLLLIGGGAATPGLAPYLASAMQVEVAAITPADLAECPSAMLERSRNTAMTLAMGLARFEGGAAA